MFLRFILKWLGLLVVFLVLGLCCFFSRCRDSRDLGKVLVVILIGIWGALGVLV